MSMSHNDWVKVFQSPLNNSSAKSLYSIPKASRFDSKNKSYCQQAFYDLPDQKMKRKAGFGYGQKYDFTRGQMKTPASSQYNLKSVFQVDREKNIGKSMGVSRAKMNQGGIMGTKNYNPGPGKYELNSTKSNIKYSFRQKILVGDPFRSPTKQYPGPGVYESAPTITPNGRYFNSKFKSSGSGLINPARSLRFQQNDKQKVPGPGQYESEQMPKNGRYHLSKTKSTQTRTFPHDKRKFFSVSGLVTPGPGSYRLPSDFGYYQARPKTTQNFRSRLNTANSNNGGRRVKTNNFVDSKPQTSDTNAKRPETAAAPDQKE